MKCPAKNCHIDIDDDSKYCDQCGSEIMICPKCQMPGIGKFCAKDGQKLESQKKNTAAPVEAQTKKDVPEKQPVQGQTQRINLNEEKKSGSITFIHSSGKELEIKNGDLLGRNEGNHESFLSGFKFISGKHAFMSFSNNQWFIKDLNSTNKTFINAVVIEPDKEFLIKAGDKIKFADQEFTVDEY